MAKIHTIMMVDADLRLLVGVLTILSERMMADGRADLALAIKQLLVVLQPHPITPVQV